MQFFGINQMPLLIRQIYLMVIFAWLLVCFFALKYQQVARAIPFVFCISNTLLLAQTNNFGNVFQLLQAILMFQLTFCDFIWNLAFFSASIFVSIWIQIKFNEEPTRASDLIVTLGAIVVNCAVATFMQVLNMRFGMFLFQIKTEDDIKKGILN